MAAVQPMAPKKGWMMVRKIIEETTSHRRCREVRDGIGGKW
jgi:hypothetical protein